MKTILKTVSLLPMLICCQESGKKIDAGHILADSPFIVGSKEYLDSPFVTAGDRLYLVGHQNGTHPELGWHIKGEMGGIWNHPIKLMDGFEMVLKIDDKDWILNQASEFHNYPMANKHVYKNPGQSLEVEQWQFVPDGKQSLVVQYKIKNLAKERRKINARFFAYPDLRPTWLGERTQMKDHMDSAAYNEGIEGWIFKDEGNPWFSCVSGTKSVQKIENNKNPYQGKGTSKGLAYNLSLGANESINLEMVISGSYTSKDQMIWEHNYIKDNWIGLLKEKQERYQKLSSMTQLTIPDKELQQAFEWLKYNCDWLIREVPEVGRGIGAGIPDYPWWFGVDSEYALMGYMAIGQFDIVNSTIDLLANYSMEENGNGRILHEMSTNGAVFNPGNINETPQFSSLIWEVYLWNGDKAFLERHFETVKKGMDWLLEANDANSNGLPEVFGMMEIHGLDSEMIDVATYTQKGLADAAKIAEELGKKDLATDYKKKADSLKDRINSSFWSHDFGSYADFIGTDDQALHLIEDALVRADTLNKPWAIEELEKTKTYVQRHPSIKPRPFVMHHNWVVNTPMEVGIADSSKALTALNTARKFINPFGVFVTGIDRDESAGKDDGSFKGSKVFSYTGAVMTLPTGVLARAENNYGRPDMALDYLKRMTRTFSYALPGSIYEVSPDYGMMVQAWNIYAYAFPIVRQFFGVTPSAANKQVTIAPLMPSEWKKASLENIRVGDNSLSIFYENGDKGQSIKVTQQLEDWQITLLLPNGQTKTGTGAEIGLIEE